ncbi:uncharacterized protein LOC125501358 [Athalia rosae]|uniref:uncharacterized protein LOC125501358 n=1 Tax=Athalia rosae TaxID=37344 RepID=UPI00203477C0|nr:uncharacterized protein LOC125501358 [Athalia rosae]
MVFQYANLELYRNCRINVHLQLQSKDDPNSWQTSYSPINLLPHLCYSVGPESTRQNIEEHGPLTNNSSNYYTAFIPHLYPNKKHRIWVNGICYASQNNNQIRIFTNTIPFWTTCRGTHLFKIEPGDTYLTVYKRRITECNDRIDALYEISISKVGTNLGHQLVLGNFPVNLTHPRLDPFSKYKVSIADIQDLGNKLFEVIVCTLEAAPDSITRFRFTPTDTTVKLEWEPPIKMNGILRGYEVSIKMVTLLACEEVKKDTPLKDVVIRKSVQKSSVTFEKLHPYVRYNVTVITYTSKPGEPYLDEFETHPTDIPTAKFSNFRFMINFTKLTWSPPEDCTTISGPLRAAVLFFYSSDSMKRVYAIQTEHSTLNLQAINLTAFTNHTVRLYALRSPTSARNPRMYQSLTWMTPATAPPPVTDVTIFDVDPESFTISLRWLPPMPTNGKIELYQVKYLNSQSMAVWNGSVSDKSIMCQLRENFVCAEDIKILFNNSLFKVCAKNEDVEKLGCTQPISLKTINFRNAKPAQPEDILVTPSISGIVNLQWELPKISIKKIKGFEIIYQLSGTKLLKLPSSNDIFGAKLLKRQDRKYELHLLPSSEYKISLFSTDQNVRSEEVEKSFWTRTAIAFADGKELQVSHNGTLINVEIPEIVNITKSTKLEVMVNGPITCDAHSPKNSNGNQTSVMNLIAASYSAGNITDKQLTIGGSKTIENVGSKCDLHYGESYTIVVKIIDESVYYNKSRKIHLIDGEESEAGSNLIWLIILPILVIGIAILFYIWSRRSRITIIRDPIYANML